MIKTYTLACLAVIGTVSAYDLMRVPQYDMMELPEIENDDYMMLAEGGK